MEKAFHGLADPGERKKGAGVAPEEGSSPGREGGGWSVVACWALPTCAHEPSHPEQAPRFRQGPSGERVVAGVLWAGELQSLLLRGAEWGRWTGPECIPGLTGVSVRGPGEALSLAWES